MKRRLLVLPILFLVSLLSLSKSSFSQGVGIGTIAPDVSAALDITHNAKGLLIPRMNTTAILAIPTPAKGLMAYDSLTNQVMINIGTPDIPNWQPVSSGNSNSGWSLTGNNGINPVNQFVGTTDNQPLRFRINNLQAGELHPVTGNIYWGLRAGQDNTTGFSNIAIGTGALKVNTFRSNLVAIGDSALFNNGVGITATDDAAANTAIGSKSLFSNTIGSRNTATGSESLFSNTTGSINTAYGGRSLFSNTSGRFNTATGFSSLFSNTTGEDNTATGASSLFSNTTGHDNTAAGFQSLASNTTGASNTATGSQALLSNSTGGDNTAVGGGSLRLNTTGNNNTATGSLSLNANTTGNDNTATGVEALFTNTTGKSNTAGGRSALFSNTTGNENTATGFQSLFLNTIGDGNTAYGSFSLSRNTTGIGNTATGSGALFNNISGGVNTAVGDLALTTNTTGRSNTATGVQSLFLNTTGDFNTAVGGNALGGTLTASNNTVMGFNAAFDFEFGSDNVIIGAEADATANGVTNSVAIGKDAKATADNQVRLGNTLTTSIGGIVGFTNISDGRYKNNIREGVKGIDFIMKLRPVTYLLDIAGINKKLNVKTDGKVVGENKTIQSGFVAQEVEQAAKEAGYDFSGVDKPKNENDMYGLRYAEFVVPLVKAVQEQQAIIKGLQIQVEAAKAEIPMQIGKQQQIIEELKKTNAGQKNLIEDLLKRVERLESSSGTKK